MEGQPVGHILILTTGHVEETSLSSLVLWHPGGFGNVEVALALVGKVLVETANKQREWQQERVLHDHPACPHCGERPLGEIEPLDRDDLAILFRDLCSSTIDGASDFTQGLMDYGFEFPQYDTPDHHWTRLVNVLQYADEILADVALGRTTKPDERGWINPAYDWKHHILKPEDLPWAMPKT
jgi:hypothetical protein